MSTPLLEVDSLDAGYHGQRVLRDISFAVPEGGLITIIGPNGHGKTTLLRAVSGLIQPMAGEIRFAGQALGRARVDQIVALGIVHIPQGDMIFSEMTVRDNLLMGAYLPGPFKQLRQRPSRRSTRCCPGSGSGRARPPPHSPAASGGCWRSGAG